jgi:hypothetical protein
MSTFIYTLQRKVKELQNTLRSLQEQNYNLRNRARMLSEAAPPGPPPGGAPQVTGAEQMFPPTYGGLGSSAFLTRTTQAPGGAQNWWEDPKYFGFSLNGVNNTIINPNGNIETFIRQYQAITLSNGMVIYIPDFPPPSFSARSVHALITANLLANPGFAGSYGSGAEMIEAIRQGIYQAGEQGILSSQQVNSIIYRLNQSNLNNYFNSAWTSINRYGSWDMNNPPPSL